MMANSRRLALKTAYISVGAVLISVALAATVLSNVHEGVWATLIVGAAALLYGLLLEKALRLPIAVNALFLALVTVGFTFSLAILLYGTGDTSDYKEDAVIVLGCGIKGERVGNSLKQRLDGAVEYHRKNPTALIVVSGGRGEGEDISEALAMERYLTSHGVPQDIIIKEDKSTSTKENFAFSKRILDERFDGEYKAVYITNGYHVYRAGIAAEEAGVKDIAGIGVRTPVYMVIPCVFRECMAVVNYFLF